MDKKNTIIGLALLMAAFTLMVFQQQRPPAAPFEAVEEVRPPELAPGATPPPPEPRAPALAVTPADPSPAQVAEEIVRLENGFIAVEFTNLGGAIRRVVLKAHALAKGSEERYILNDVDPVPALALLDLPGAGPEAGYQVLSRTDSEISFGLALSDSVQIVRHYSLQRDAGRSDPSAYLVQHRTEFLNTSGQPLLLSEFGVHLGTAIPTGRQMLGMEHLNFNYYDGRRFRHLAPRKFEGGGFMSWIGMRSNEPKPFIEERLPVMWASVKNQFFASILTPEQQPVGFVARPVTLPLEEGERRALKAMTGNLRFDLRGIPADGAQVLNASFYAGPKEYRRLEAMGQNQDRVMQFGWPFFAFISKLLLSMMVAIHSFIPNYGVSIILVTVIIKTILWPLTAQAARSSKRMGKIQEPMKALREKYKDDPRRMQMETMKLFREAKVNPLGGCLPMLVQIPIFFGLFRMIMSAAELRFAEFLWVGDLSAPDTIATIMGLPINILPVMMGVTMYYQMRMMPMAMDSTQQKIFRLMPLIMFVFCYSFSSGLVLYWTVQNLLTILQQYLTNRKKDDPTPALATVGGEPVQASPYLKKKKGKKKKAE
jgi:YidC/Oxa1 family membrane protein insertase